MKTVMEDRTGPARANARTDMHSASRSTPRVGLLTGGDDRSYAVGLATALIARGVHLDFIGSDAVDAPELHDSPFFRFLNLRGDQSPQASLRRKVSRLARYYFSLMRYAAAAPGRVLHILWNNKFEHFDRTVLMLYYRALGHRVVMTVHNVNAAARDGRDSWLNRLTLRIQYRLCEHLFVHTPRMCNQLFDEFGIATERVSVIPFGINDTTPKTAITQGQARDKIGLASIHRVLLFFGQIAPYKGLEYLVAALQVAFAADPALRLVVAGKVKKGCEDYWNSIALALSQRDLGRRVLQRIEHVPDDEIELYFKAADVLVVPYVEIFQSGVPFLAYSFGLPVIATDVGALRDDVIEGRTGFVCRSRDPNDLAGAIARYFDSPLYVHRDRTHPQIRAHAMERHSWATVAAITEAVYRNARTC
jgi:D-inositol-3-phosphate glycosyltransferase